MSKKVLIIADAHIKARTWTNSTLLQNDAYEALRLLETKLRQMSEETRPDTLVSCGDWYDSNRPSVADVMHTGDFKRMFANILYVKGNHDGISPNWLEAEETADPPYEIYPMSCESSILQEADKRNIQWYGLDWTGKRDSLLQGLKKIAEKALALTERFYVVLHCGMRHLINLDGMWQLQMEDLAEIFGDMKVTILVGHIHKRDTRVIKNIVVHSPGPLYPVAMDQAHGYVGASLLVPETGEISELRTDVRDYVDLKYSTMDKLVVDLKTAIDLSKERRPLPPFISVDITGSTGFDQMKIPEDVRNACRIHIIDNSMAAPVVADIANNAYTLDQAVADELAADADIAAMGSELVLSDDPVALIDSWFDDAEIERITK